MGDRRAVSTQPSPMGTADTATLELLASWKAEDATTDPEQLRKADQEIAEFKRRMNESRAAAGARLLFRCAVFSSLIQARSDFCPHPQHSAEVVGITDWLSGCIVAGDRVIVPAIIYYES